MPHEVAALFHDALIAGQEAQTYISSDLAGYLADARTRRAVERCLEIVGEALAQVRKMDEDALIPIPHAARIIGLRNILIHEYVRVDSALIWHTVQLDLPVALRAIEAELYRIGK